MIDGRRSYAVDRLEDDRVVLVADDDGAVVVVQRTALSFPVREAMVLVVPLDDDGHPEWARAERDEAEERRRLAEGTARIERLKRRDPGGDISL